MIPTRRRICGSLRLREYGREELELHPDSVSDPDLSECCPVALSLRVSKEYLVFYSLEYVT